MSVTTTDNARITALRHTLADYDLHHSQPTSEAESSAPEPNSRPVASTQNPPEWETQWRRVPAHRPANPNLLDEGGRNEFNNAIERNFIRVMFGGVHLQARASQIWRATGGRINDRIFRISIGGEW